jgi:predicted O-methyltransferase YrrM
MRHASLSKPISLEIERLVRDIPGWSPADQLLALFTLVYSTAGLPGDVIEVGSWCGRSSVVLGLAATLSDRARVYCIDLFPGKEDWHVNPDGTYSIEVKVGSDTFSACVEQTVWAEAFERDIAPIYKVHESTLELFSAAIANNDLGDIVVPHKGTSTTFRHSAPNSLRCKLAFIDGDHGYEAVRNDIQNVEDLLLPGGWICLDDAFTVNRGIDRAISELIIDSGNYECCCQLTRKLFVAKKKRQPARGVL